MSSLLHPIHTASQKCRPKHQALVLQCYPKYQKNVQEVKPNSSELSYLLYYVSTRRSKLQKVGVFLEKKTASDVWRQKLGNVQVTLQILTAIIDKTPRDLSLYAGYVLFIVETVLKSKDINMVEETLPVFEAFCKNIDAPHMTADAIRQKQYLSIVETYAQYASETQSRHIGRSQSIPLSIRWRTASLRAIRAVVGSDALSADSNAQLNFVMPVILDNLSLEDHQILDTLQQRAQTGEKISSEVARKRRLSVATVGTVDTTEMKPAVATETTADADNAAEQEVRVLAVRCLKQIFSISTSSTRGQTRLATALTLRFIAAKHKPMQLSEKASIAAYSQGTWASSLFEAIARWTPVQDRFVIVLTAMETLVRSPIIEASLDKQLVLAQMIDWLLRSDVNLIGLSVMDLLLGLIQHTLLLLQLGGRDSKFVPGQDLYGIYKEAKDTFDPSSLLTEPDEARGLEATATYPSPTRIELLSVLQKCISDLATHIYYTDQITDMLTAILARLKPSAQSEVSSTTAAINNPAAATRAIVDSASLQEDPSTDGFFSFATARVIALKSVKDILITVNSHKTSTGASSEVRSRVGVQVWEGTQWLLKDEDQEVRFAYVDALLTWVKLETNKNDLLIPKDGTKKTKQGRKDESRNGENKLAKRAVSNASRKETRTAKSTFFQLLHLAIFDNALDFADSVPDVLSLYLLLSVMIDRLGVNVLRTGLPMIIALQNAVLHEERVQSAQGKIIVASLVHGYLWKIIEKFDIEPSRVGHEVNSEVSRRKRYSIWLDSIRFPPVSLDQIREYGARENALKISESSVGSLKPILDVTDLVNEIANSYDRSLLTPPSSPPASPGRVFSVPTLGFGYGYGLAPAARPAPSDQLSQKVKDEMCGQWSRENCIASVEKESTASVTGSKAGGSGRQHLSVQALNGTGSGRESPANAAGDVNLAPNQAGVGLGGLGKGRGYSASGSAVNLTNTSSRDSTMRVSDLKRALAGYTSGRNESPLRRPLTASRRSFHDDESDSMMSWDETDGHDGSFIESEVSPEVRQTDIGTAVSAPKMDGLVHDVVTTGGSTSRKKVDDGIPPVPKIPSNLNLPGTFPRDMSPKRPASPKQQNNSGIIDTESPQSRRVASTSHASLKSHGRTAKTSSRPASRAGGAATWSQKSAKADLKSFLAGIDTTQGDTAGDVNKENGRTKAIVPPY